MMLRNSAMALTAAALILPAFVASPALAQAAAGPAPATTETAAPAAPAAPAETTAGAATAAAAPATADFAVGTTVFDPQGGEVGKVKSVSGENVVVDTGTDSAALPANAFAKGPNGPVIAMTKDKLNAAIAAAKGSAPATAKP